VDQAARRKSDALARTWLANHLESGKLAIEQYSARLVDQGLYDPLPQCDQLRGRLDLLIARLRANPSGRSPSGSSGALDDDLLEDLYEHDLWAMDEAERLVGEMSALARSADSAPQVLQQLQDRVAAIENKWEERRRLLETGKP
jgi:hypothetical protein